jgi:hypothetical protein
MISMFFERVRNYLKVIFGVPAAAVTLLLLTGVMVLPPKLVKTKLSNGITVSLPEDLKPMTPEDIALRFPSVRAPLGAFTNADRLVDFSANISATQWPDNDLNVAKSFFKASLYNLYDRVDMISEGVYEVHHRRFIYFEFESRVNGGKFTQSDQPAMFHYTYIQYLLEPGRALVFSFHCPKDQREEWQPVAKTVMKSIVIK